MKKITDGAFLAVVMITLLACLVRTIFFPTKISAGENRYANQIEEFTMSAYMDGSYQEGVESALADQALLSAAARRSYNYFSAKIRELLLSGLYETNVQRYVSLSKNINLFGGYLVYDMRSLEEIKSDLDRKIENINSFAVAHPEVPLYVYYIEKDTDINFETGERTGSYEYVAGLLNIPEENMRRLEIKSFEQYSRMFFRTDHHWNHIGSYLCCCEIMELLGTDEPIRPAEEITIDHEFSGSKAIDSGNKDVYSEEFTAYRFDYPPMTITVNGRPDDYGAQEDYFAGSDEELTYGSFYGGDEGEVVINTGMTDKENLLIIGDSHDNAILKLMAGSFNRVHSVDLRCYEALLGKKFDTYQYIVDNDIDKVLLMGSDGFFISEDIWL